MAWTPHCLDGVDRARYRDRRRHHRPHCVEGLCRESAGEVRSQAGARPCVTRMEPAGIEVRKGSHRYPARCRCRDRACWSGWNGHLRRFRRRHPVRDRPAFERARRPLRPPDGGPGRAGPVDLAGHGDRVRGRSKEDGRTRSPPERRVRGSQSRPRFLSPGGPRAPDGSRPVLPQGSCSITVWATVMSDCFSSGPVLSTDTSYRP